MADETPSIYDSYGSYRYFFMNFRSREELNEEGEKAFDHAKRKWSYLKDFYSKSEFSRSFVGTSYEEAEKGDFTKFIDEKDLENSIEFFDDTLAKIDMGGSFKKQRIIITNDQRGIFDFSLASKGLYRLQEYFSEELAKDSPLEFMHLLPGLVDPDLVQRDQMGQFWYNSQTKKYFLTQQQKGTRAIELGIEGAKLEFATSTKKSYLMFEKRGGKAKMVDLYVGVGGLAELNSNAMLARSMPLLLAAKVFEKAGIHTRISANRMYSDGKKVIALTYPLKDYGEELDFNWIALNCSDTRWFRWNLWKYTSGLLDQKFNINQIGNGSTIYGGSLLDETFTRYKNWYGEQIQLGTIDPLRINKNLMIAGGLPDPQNTKTMNQKDAILKEFYRIVDMVEFIFADDVEIPAKRIYEQWVEKEKKGVFSYKAYCISLLSRAYGYSEGGQYATDQTEIDHLDEEYERKMQRLNNYFESTII